MPVSQIASGFALAAAMLFGSGCDLDPEIPEDLTVETVDDGDEEPDDAGDDASTAETHLAACDWLGADRTCGGERKGVQFCAWLYNEQTAEVSTYWGECIEEPECSLWSCRERDGALCDLVDGKPQWMPNACSW